MGRKDEGEEREREIRTRSESSSSARCTTVMLSVLISLPLIVVVGRCQQQHNDPFHRSLISSLLLPNVFSPPPGNFSLLSSRQGSLAIPLPHTAKAHRQGKKGIPLLPFKNKRMMEREELRKTPV